MHGINRSEDIDHRRRRFFGTVAITIAAAQLGTIGAAGSPRSRHAYLAGSGPRVAD